MAHNWHVHEKQVSSDCMSTGGHYNPFQVDLQVMLHQGYRVGFVKV